MSAPSPDTSLRPTTSGHVTARPPPPSRPAGARGKPAEPIGARPRARLAGLHHRPRRRAPPRRPRSAAASPFAVVGRRQSPSPSPPTTALRRRHPAPEVPGDPRLRRARESPRLPSAPAPARPRAAALDLRRPSSVTVPVRSGESPPGSALPGLLRPSPHLAGGSLGSNSGEPPPASKSAPGSTLDLGGYNFLPSL
nr:translation initiation factor IF-2-like [Aegilops tauschii subsp. strangulata]